MISLWRLNRNTARPLLSVFMVFSVIMMAYPNTAWAQDPGIDFRAGKGKDAWVWLADNNFILERDAKNKSKTSLSLSDRGLELKALKGAQAMIAFKKGHIDTYRDIEIVWGVDKFPEGASYAQGKRNEAVMVYVFFGKETIDSGALVVPDSPYFIGLQLCENDPLDTPQKGRFFHKGGRFICVAHPKSGEAVTTRFNLKKAFEDIYGFPAPPLYAGAIEFDTTNPQDDGTSAAFVTSIRFPHAHYYNN